MRVVVSLFGCAYLCLMKQECNWSVTDLKFIHECTGHSPINRITALSTHFVAIDCGILKNRSILSII